MSEDEGPGYICDRMKAMRVLPPREWLQEHHLHGGIEQEDAGHPSGDWVRLTCKCGAKYVTAREKP